MCSDVLCHIFKPLASKRSRKEAEQDEKRLGLLGFTCDEAFDWRWRCGAVFRVDIFSLRGYDDEPPAKRREAPNIPRTRHAFKARECRAWVADLRCQVLITDGLAAGLLGGDSDDSLLGFQVRKPWLHEG